MATYHGNNASQQANMDEKNLTSNKPPPLPDEDNEWMPKERESVFWGPPLISPKHIYI